MNRLHSDLDGVWREIAASVSVFEPRSDRLDPGRVSADFALDPDQARAARHDHGPLRVLAPAGSGKTRTLTARIARLVIGGVPAERILALAFNTKAAAEMAQRLAAAGHGDVRPRTFHSLGYEIVREAGGPRFDPEHEQRLRGLALKLLENHLPMPAHPGERRRLERRALAVLIAAKARLTPYSAMAVASSGVRWDLAAAFDAWIAAQKSLGWLSYADMIYFAVCDLAVDPELRRRWQSRYDFVLVDEFQDLNAAQMLLLRILALPANNLFAVGDDDQLIYAWRGAEADHILDFARAFPGAASIVLGTNYRSGRRLIRHGRWLIEHNPARVAKDIRPENSAEPGRLEIVLRGTAAEQARAAAAWVRATKASNELEWGDFGLLYRANRDAKSLEQALAEAGIPFRRIRDEEREAGDPALEIAGLSPEDFDFDDAFAEREDPAARGFVTLATIHKSKGVEFAYVVYFNLRGAPGPDEADERRVAYVGLTRAARGLLITAERSRPSPFLAELALNPDFDDYAEPYLERELALARRRACRRRGDWSGWVRTFLPVRLEDRGAAPAEPADAGEDGVDLLASELHFRRVLGIEKKA